MPGYRIVKVLGIVTGMSARTRGLGGRIPAWLEAHVGGRSEAYVAELKRAREEAVQDPIKEAAKLGANAVVGADFETSEVLEGFVVVTAAGTAAVVEPGQPSGQRSC